MINELYQLAEVLEKAGELKEKWHKDYNTLSKEKCYKITVNNGEVVGLSKVSEDLKRSLRKYGNNFASYPCMNLAPLYDVADEDDRKLIELLSNKPETLNDDNLSKLRAICERSADNWNEKNFVKYYGGKLVKGRELLENCGDYEPLAKLVEDTALFENDRAKMRAQISDVAFNMLKARDNVETALEILFHWKSNNTLSVVFESQACVEAHSPTVHADFVNEVNRRLLAKMADESQIYEKSENVDAFGDDLVGNESGTMPKRNLPNGMSGVIIRSMNPIIECQHRYGLAGSDSYPLVAETQLDLASALDWIADEKKEGKTWLKIESKMTMFCYAHGFLSEATLCGINLPDGKGEKIISGARRFLQQFTTLRTDDEDSRASGIRIFILWKINNAQSKVVYTRQTDPYELERLLEEWDKGCKNLPEISDVLSSAAGKNAVVSNIIEPLDVADTLNMAFKRDGTQISSKKKVQKYHGIQILMEPDMSIDGDFRSLVQQEMKIAEALGLLRADKEYKKPLWLNAANMLKLTALMLYRKGIEKEVYMKNLPYLFGQMLRISDDLHLFYCETVRDGHTPPQLAGGAMVSAATEAPARTFAHLGKRMMPYYNWAKSYLNNSTLITEGDNKNNEKVLGNKRKAGWIINTYGLLAKELSEVMSDTVRFNDEEKAQLFIGYFAKLPKPDKTNNNTNATEEEQNNEQQ